VKHPDLEKALNIWVNQAVVSGLSISENLLYKKACYYAMVINISVEDMKFSNRWLSGFKQRNNLKVHKIHEEANTASIELLPDMRNELRTLIARYRPENVFNANETGLFYRMESNQTLSSGLVSEKKK
ncbi:2687_t:CDS:1, partial [Dentiscutata heterogama]